MTARDALRALLEQIDPRAFSSAAMQVAMLDAREALAPPVEFTALGTGVTDVRELAAVLTAETSRVCAGCGRPMERERDAEVEP